jgi:hypothetical protein
VCGRVHGRVGPAAVAHVLPGAAGHEQLLVLLLLLVGLVAAAPRQLTQRDGVVAAPPAVEKMASVALAAENRTKH